MPRWPRSRHDQDPQVRRRPGLQAAPLAACSYLVLALVAGLTPVVIAWLTKLAIDELVAGATLRTLLGLAAALVVAGTTAALIPP